MRYKRDERRNSKIIATKTRSEWLTLFSETNTCVAPVLTLEEMEQDPQVQARQMIQDIEFDEGMIRHIGMPIKLSETPGRIRARAKTWRTYGRNFK